MVNINLYTSNKTFREILGNGLKYEAPCFQHDYAWTDEQWTDLWQDIGQEPYNIKKALFTESTLEISKKVAQYPEWSKSPIESRQEWLAKKASACLAY